MVCRREQVSAALVQGIGFSDEMKIRIYDRDSDTFLFHTVKGPMEITSLTGNIARADNGLYAHLHIMAADREMNVKGGHLISCRDRCGRRDRSESLRRSLFSGRIGRSAAGTDHF